MHQTRHFHAVSAVIRHLKVTKQDAVSDSVLAEAATQFLDSVLQLLPPGQPLVVHEDGKLVGLILGNEIDGAYCDGTHFGVPAVLLLK